MSVVFGNTFREKIYGQEGVDLFESALREEGYNGYLRALRRHCHGQIMPRNFRKVAELYKDDRLEIDTPEEGQEKFRAFFDSATLATGALLLCANERQQLSLLSRAPINIMPAESDEDPDAHSERLRNTILNYGHEGYDMASLYVPVFERIEDTVSPHVTTLNIAKAAFGLPFYIANKILEAEQVEQEARYREEIQASAQQFSEATDEDFEKAFGELSL